jgi:hypothetical protein
MGCSFDTGIEDSTANGPQQVCLYRTVLLTVFSQITAEWYSVQGCRIKPRSNGFCLRYPTQGGVQTLGTTLKKITHSMVDTASTDGFVLCRKGTAWGEYYFHMWIIDIFNAVLAQGC